MTESTNQRAWVKGLVALGRGVARFVYRWTKRAVIAFSVLIAVLLLLLSAIQLTETGRALVLRVALEQTNTIIPGTVKAKRLGRLSLLGVELWGVRAGDPTGKEVARIEHVSVTTDLSGLLSGTIALQKVQLEHAWVDLRELDKSESGLIAAFVDPNAPPSPPSDAPPPDISVAEIRVRDVQAELPPLEQVGQLHLDLKKLDGNYALLGGTSTAEVDALEMEVRRNDEDLVELALAGQLPIGKKPTVLHLTAQSGPMTAQVDAEMVLPSEHGWEGEPARAKVTVTGVTAAQIAKVLNDPTLEDAFLGEVGLTLTADGSPDNVVVDGALSTAGGTLHFDELHAHKKHLRAVVSSDGLLLSKLRSDLPPRKVAAVITAETDGFPPDPVEVSLRVEKTEVDEVALPVVTVSGVLTDSSLSNLALKARDGDSRVDVTGDVQFSGDAQLTVQVDLRPDLVHRLGSLLGEDITGRVVTSAAVDRKASGLIVASGKAALTEVERNSKEGDDIKVGSLDADFSVQGTPPDLRGKLSGSVKDAALGERQLDQATLAVSGNAKSLDIKLDAEGGLGDPDANGKRPAERAAKVALTAHVERGGETTQITGTGEGTIQGQSLVFDLAPTTVTDQGAILTEGIDLELGGQKLHVEGGLAPSGRSEGITVNFGPIALAELPQLVAVDPDLVGTVQGRATISGTIKIPQVTLEASASGVGLKRRALIDAELKAEFDAKEGKLHSTVLLKSPQGFDANVTADAQFVGGANWTATAPDAQFDATLAVAELNQEFLRDYLPPGALPIPLTARSNIRVHGSQKDPRLSAQTDVTISLIGEKPAILSLTVDYAEGRLVSDLGIRDGHGPWTSASAQLTLPDPPPTAATLADAFGRAAPDGTWTFNLEVKPRSLSELAIVSLVTDPKELPAVKAGLQFSAEHQPKTEPTAHLTVDVEQSAAISVGACQAKGVSLKIEFDHKSAQNHLQVHGAQGQKELLELVADVPLLIQPILEGQDPAPGPLDFSFESQKLELASLPFVCGRAVGTMQADVSGKDVVGMNPNIDADLSVKGFSLGSRDTLDLTLRAQASKDTLDAQLDIVGRGASSKTKGSFEGHVPWKLSEGHLELEKDAPLDAELHLTALPIAPLFPPRGAISYARGSIDGDITARGKLNAPDVHGSLRLNDIAFTSTSIAQPLRGIKGEIALLGRTVEVRKLEAHDQDGTLTLNGSVDLGDMERLTGKIHIVADEFPLRQRGQVVAVTNLDATAESTVTPEKTEAVLTLRKVDTWLETVAVRTGIALDAHEEFVINGKAPKGSAIAKEVAEQKAVDRIGQQTEKDTSQKPEDPHLITIVIDAQDRFWVKRDDFAVKLNTLLTTKIEGDAVRVKGDVTIDRGYLQLFGKVFDLKRESKIRFIGSNPPNPVLELEAENKTRAGSIVGVRISGRADAPELTFYVDGEVVDAGVAVAELFGGEKGGDDSDATTQAKSFVSGLTAGVLATAARRELGAAAPIIMIDPSDKSGEGRVRAGFELDDIVPKFLRPIVTGVYLEGIVARESQGDTAANTQFGALLELYFPKNFFAAGQYGPGSTWSVDFGWQL